MSGSYVYQWLSWAINILMRHQIIFDPFWWILLKKQLAKLFSEFDSQSILPNIDIEIWDNPILISQYVVSILISYKLTCYKSIFEIPLQSASLTKFRMGKLKHSEEVFILSMFQLLRSELCQKSRRQQNCK